MWNKSATILFFENIERTTATIAGKQDHQNAFTVFCGIVFLIASDNIQDRYVKFYQQDLFTQRVWIFSGIDAKDNSPFAGFGRDYWTRLYGLEEIN